MTINKSMTKLIYFFSLYCLTSLTILPRPGYSQCKDLRKQVDKFDGSITIQSPIYKSITHEPVMIIRREVKNRIYFLLRLRVWASASPTQKGAYLLLDDGTKLEWPDEEVEVNYKNFFYAHSTITLTPEQLEKLSKTPITDIRLHVFDMNLKKKDGERFRDYIECAIIANVDEVKEGLK